MCHICYLILYEICLEPHNSITLDHGIENLQTNMVTQRDCTLFRPKFSRAVLSLCFISFVNGGISCFGIKNVERLKRSRNILYLSLNVDLKY